MSPTPGASYGPCYSTGRHGSPAAVGKADDVATSLLSLLYLVIFSGAKPMPGRTSPLKDAKSTVRVGSWAPVNTGISPCLFLQHRSHSAQQPVAAVLFGGHTPEPSTVRGSWKGRAASGSRIKHVERSYRTRRRMKREIVNN